MKVKTPYQNMSFWETSRLTHIWSCKCQTINISPKAYLDFSNTRNDILCRYERFTKSNVKFQNLLTTNYYFMLRVTYVRSKASTWIGFQCWTKTLQGCKNMSLKRHVLPLSFSLKKLMSSSLSHLNITTVQIIVIYKSST